MVCFTKLTPRTPPSVIHGWKATDLLSQMVKRKNYLLNPVSRQNFANALAENHNLKLEVCLKQTNAIELKFPQASFAFLLQMLLQNNSTGHCACTSRLLESKNNEILQCRLIISEIPANPPAPWDSCRELLWRPQQPPPRPDQEGCSPYEEEG